MVTLPVWVFVALLLFAAWSLFGRLLIPTVRWVLRRRVNRLLEEVNTRLKIQIPPFKLTRRAVLIDRLVHDPEVQETARAAAREQAMPIALVTGKVVRYAREIVPSFNAYAYFRIGYSAARALARTLYRVRLGYSDEEGLARIPARSTVVFLINHRSNMDYILVGYLAAEKAALSYAVGEWARVWPLQALVRAMGAYFVRRNSRDALYRKVLERYIAMATASGVTQAVFPEGGLSRDGRLRPPRLGILDYMLRTFDPAADWDIVFIPVGINYDRTLEDRSYMLELEPGARRPKTGRALAKAAGFALRNLRLMASNRWHRFGYACVNFGSPISARDYARSRGVAFHALAREERFARVEELAVRLMRAVAGVIPVVPVSLVATAFVRAPARRWSELELKAEALRLMGELSSRGAHVYVPRRDQDYAITVGLRMLTLRRLVRCEEGLYAAEAAELPLLTYYANSIAHFFEAQPVESAAAAGAGA
jgi:glycerol-3-phosphate O-acyltransferase